MKLQQLQIFQNLTEEELEKKLPQISVYARVSPEHKIRIVKASIFSARVMHR